MWLRGTAGVRLTLGSLRDLEMATPANTWHKQLLFISIFLFTISLSPSAFCAEKGRFENAVRLFGWVQATCYYASQGWLTASQTRDSIEQLLERLYREHSQENAEPLRIQALTNYSECAEFFPAQYR